MTASDDLLTRMNEAFAAAQERRFDFVLKHWVDRLENMVCRGPGKAQKKSPKGSAAL